MVLRSVFGAPARALALLLAAVLASTAPALAQATTTLTGTVTDGGTPVPAAAVTASGANLNLSAKTDERGAFRFSAIPVGTYTVTASAPKGSASLRVDVPGAGASVTLSVSQLRQIGRTSVTARPPVRGSGTDVSLGAEALTRSPAGGSLPNLLVQLPGAARGANGVVHLNGDHGDINYIVDGVQIPQALNRTVGTELDPNDIAFVEALQGAYPAQYGERFAAVINVNSRNGAGPPASSATSPTARTPTSTAPSATTPGAEKGRSSPRCATSAASAASTRRTSTRRTTASATPTSSCA